MTSPFADSHTQQAGQVGCLYHSANAVLDLPELLQHAHDTSAARFHCRLAELGLLCFTLFCSDPPGPPASPEFWERLRERFTRDNTPGQPYAPLLVNIPGSTPDWLHQVAVALPTLEGGDTVHISDSNFPEPFSVPWAVFLHSDYARAARVEIIGPLDLDAYPEGKL